VPAGQEPDWSPAGLLVVDGAKGHKAIVVVKNGHSSDVRRGDYSSASWSPDHMSIVATKKTDKGQQLVIISYPGGKPESTSISGWLGVPVWDTR
jgi:hypothetical protein